MTSYHYLLIKGIKFVTYSGNTDFLRELSEPNRAPICRRILELIGEI